MQVCMVRYLGDEAGISGDGARHLRLVNLRLEGTLAGFQAPGLNGPPNRASPNLGPARLLVVAGDPTDTQTEVLLELPHDLAVMDVHHQARHDDFILG